MGVTVEITNVDKEANSITFTQDGESRSLPVVLPAQIKWARNGKADVGINAEGKVNFIKSLEPKPVTNQYGQGSGGFEKPAPKSRAINNVEKLDGVTLAEYKSVYDNINATQNKKCSASTLFQIGETGKDVTRLYDVTLYVTTFVPIGSALDPVVAQPVAQPVVQPVQAVQPVAQPVVQPVQAVQPVPVQPVV